MRRILASGAIALLLAFVLYPVAALTPGRWLILQSGNGGKIPSWVLPTAVIDEIFTTGQYYPRAITLELVDSRTGVNQYVPNSSGNPLTSITAGNLPIGTAGLLNEPAVTNQMLQTGFATGWATSNVTLAANSAVAPDGTMTASTLTDTSTSAIHFIVSPTLSTSQPAAQIYSVYIKGGTLRYASILGSFGSVSSQRYGVTLDTSNCAIQGTVVTDNPSYQVTNVGAGWCRVSMGTIYSGNTPNFLIGGSNVATAPAAGTNGNTYAGTGQTLFLWIPQVEQGASISQSPSSPIGTTTVAVQRSANNITVQRIGLGTLTFIYSDTTTQTIYPSAGLQEAIPTNLNEPLITRLTGYATLAASRQGGTTSALPNSTVSAAQGGARVVDVARARIDSIKLAIPNFYINGNPVTENSTGGTQTDTASIEYPIGTEHQMLFNGSTSGSSSNALIWTDELNVAIPAGATYAYRIWGSNTASKFPIAQNYGPGGSGTSVFQYGATVPDNTLGGTWSNTSAGNNWLAAAVVTRQNGKAVCTIGDSISYGYTNNGPAGIVQGSLAATIPVLNLGVPSDEAQWFLLSNTTRLALATYCTSFSQQYGINDIASGRTAAQIMADRASIAALLPGPQVQTTITPRSTSTDNWATTGNQTAVSSTTYTSLQNLIRALPTYIDIAAPVETSQNSDLWDSVGSGKAQQVSGDGIHPTIYGYGLVVTSGNVNPALFQ